MQHRACMRTFINSPRRPSQTFPSLSDPLQRMLAGTLQLEGVCQSAPSIVAIQPHYLLFDAVYIWGELIASTTYRYWSLTSWQQRSSSNWVCLRQEMDKHMPIMTPAIWSTAIGRIHIGPNSSPILGLIHARRLWGLFSKKFFRRWWTTQEIILVEVPGPCTITTERLAIRELVGIQLPRDISKRSWQTVGLAGTEKLLGCMALGRHRANRCLWRDWHWFLGCTRLHSGLIACSKNSHTLQVSSSISILQQKNHAIEGHLVAENVVAQAPCPPWTR